MLQYNLIINIVNIQVDDTKLFGSYISKNLNKDSDIKTVRSNVHSCLYRLKSLKTADTLDCCKICSFSQLFYRTEQSIYYHQSFSIQQKIVGKPGKEWKLQNLKNFTSLIYMILHDSCCGLCATQISYVATLCD